MAEKPPEDHAERVHASFDALDRQVGGRLDPDARAAIDRVRTAAAERDAEAMRTHMESLRERHGWLYNELAAHPQVATLLDELALWGF
ncbi:MAG TPA: hypothetical protein VFA98_12895 [Thermoanaerobaculia bacterium]|jgi:hypothetical protein|nr:hypothetical protein [Thermoanaerobaculia bacterium]